MPWAAVGAIGGALIASDASQDASSTQARSTDRAADISNDQYKQNREDRMPWIQSGLKALPILTDQTTDPNGDFARGFSMADFQKDPGYDFRRNEGMRGLEASAAARGGVLNGGHLKALDRYNQDYASNEYSNAYNRFNNDRTQRFNRLSSLAGNAQTMTNNLANEGSQLAANLSEYGMQGANAQAAGAVGSANAYNKGISNLTDWYQGRNSGKNGGGNGGNGGFGGGEGYSGDVAPSSDWVDSAGGGPLKTWAQTPVDIIDFWG